MNLLFHQLLAEVLAEGHELSQIRFASDRGVPLEVSYQVNFPRLELVFSGHYSSQLWSADSGLYTVQLTPRQVLYIPPNAWNKPDWEPACSVLSLLFGKRQLGFSLVSKQAGREQPFDVHKHSIPAPTGRALEHILPALDALSREAVTAPMDRHLLLALLSGVHQLLTEADGERPRGVDLFHGICIYIQENFHRAISRESIAERFNLSPGHLSRLFRDKGHMRLADYITRVRLERAKFMLRKYHFHLAEVAQRCGYQDVNYFCRVFREKTGVTPSQYRELSQPGGPAPE